MSNPANLPSHTSCGSCGASLALFWETRDGLSLAGGSCPKCGRAVLSAMGDDQAMAAFFEYAASTPEGILTMYFSRKTRRRRGSRL
jgi:hypothetical protein